MLLYARAEAVLAHELVVAVAGFIVQPEAKVVIMVVFDQAAVGRIDIPLRFLWETKG